MDEQMKLDKKVEEQLAAIRADLDSRNRGIAKVTDTDRGAHRKLLDGMTKVQAYAWQDPIRGGKG